MSSSPTRISIVSAPRYFVSEIGELQALAIDSWRRLASGAHEITLVGNDEGVNHYARQIGAKHVPFIGCNEYGTPMLDSILDEVMSQSTHSIKAFINSDIILTEQLSNAVDIVSSQFEQFVIIGRSHGISLIDAKTAAFRTDFPSTGLRDCVDYVIYRGAPWPAFRPLALGRGNVDKWLVGEALFSNIPVIDVTSSVPTFHIDHHHRYIKAGTKELMPKSREGKRNRFLTDDVEFIDLKTCADYQLCEDALTEQSQSARMAVRIIMSVERRKTVLRICTELYPEVHRLFKLGLFDKGLLLARRIERLDPQFPGVALLLALAFLGLKNFEEARRLANLSLKEKDFAESARALMDVINDQYTKYEGSRAAQACVQST